jgi:hypothetical protein
LDGDQIEVKAVHKQKEYVADIDIEGDSWATADRNIEVVP